ncbi:OB-fold nucleic acid binding domain-containing protein, partial [Amycolatopsis sp. M39]
PLKRQEAMGQFDLFGGENTEPASSPLAHLKFTAEEWPRKQLLAHERDMLGLYVSAHPLDGAEGVLRKHASRPIAAIIDNPPKEGEIVVAGLITSLERRVNKKGEPWAICTVEDLDASLEVLFFAKSYAFCAADLVEDNAVLVKGRVNWREDRMSVFGAELAPLDLTELGETPLVLHTRAEKVTLPVVLELKQALLAHQGNTPVHLHVGERRYALDGYSVKVTPALLGEVETIRGITVGP